MTDLTSAELNHLLKIDFTRNEYKSHSLWKPKKEPVTVTPEEDKTAADTSSNPCPDSTRDK